MKKYLLILVLATATISSGYIAQARNAGDDSDTTIAPMVGPFSAVDIDATLKVTVNITEGSTPGLKITGSEKVLGQLETTVEHNTLVISTKHHRKIKFADHDHLEAVITLPSLKAVTISGSSNVIVHGNLGGPKFGLDISGSGKITIDNLNVTDFMTDISGSGNVTVSGGSVSMARYDISGAGKISSFDLSAQSVFVDISGSAKGEINVTNQLAIACSGASSIVYKGHPASFKNENSGACIVKQAD